MLNITPNISQPPLPRTESKFLLVMSKIISYIFHPIYIPTLVTLLLMKVSAVSFAGVSGPAVATWLFVIVLNTLFFPLFAVFLLKRLGFLQSIRMYDPKERIIPLIITMVFYFWAYRVISNIHNPNEPGLILGPLVQAPAPFILKVLLLGAFWGIIVLFMFNIFVKVSMHTMSAGGVLGIIIILMIISPVSMVYPLFVGLVFAGMIGTARLLLGEHTPAEIYLGYFLGIIVQLAAYWYLK